MSLQHKIIRFRKRGLPVPNPQKKKKAIRFRLNCPLLAALISLSREKKSKSNTSTLGSASLARRRRTILHRLSTKQTSQVENFTFHTTSLLSNFLSLTFNDFPLSLTFKNCPCFVYKKGARFGKSQLLNGANFGKSKPKKMARKLKIS